MDCLENMGIYDRLREVPQNAQKQIGAGRLKGMTDINPMWRIARLTEMFGPAGVGWYYKIIRKWTEDGAGGEKCAFVDIELYIKHNGEWSMPIEGTGGSMLVAQERSGLHTSDEAYKMALTDAISVACKALGMGANVYWAAGRQTKYDAQNDTPPEPAKPVMPSVSDKPKASLKPVTVERVGQLMSLMAKLPDHGAGVMGLVKTEFHTDDLSKLSPAQFNKVVRKVNDMVKSAESAA